MKDVRKQRAVYAAVLTLILAVTMGISLFTTSERSQKDDSDGGYTAEVPRESESAAESDSSLPESASVQQNVQVPNTRIESAESSEREKEEIPDGIGMDRVREESAAEGSSDSEDSLYTADMDAPEEDPMEANGIFFDPATDKMAWPVSGTVVMEYSLDNVIYDATLDQYRVNDSISISANANEAVTASASGIVAEIGYTRDLGNYVVLEHGNGFRTTYGQLDAEIPVAVAERVEKGEIIGQLTDPVWYSIALGNHVDFKVTLDGEPVDPLLYLEYEME